MTGWEEIGGELTRALEGKAEDRRVIVFETYQGVEREMLIKQLELMISPGLLINTDDLFYGEQAIRKMTQPDVTDDRVFGHMTRLHMHHFMDPLKVERARKEITESGASTVLVFGYGASLLWEHPSIMVYADMARWEIQRRMRSGAVDNLGIRNRTESAELKYKRGYFVDWRVCDRLKKETMKHWDYVLDTNRHDQPNLARARAVMEGLQQAARRPFSVVPFFDPGPWGGQWMKERFGLDQAAENYAWCFNCVPEENSLLLGFGEIQFEIPSVNLVFHKPRELLGDAVYARFGDEFPIRFDFLDTMAGGNLSLQVHPLTQYIREHFGLPYTQDESYYMMDAEKDGSVYLGLREGVDREEMIRELRRSEREGIPFMVERYVENWPAKKHDHFLIPAGTIHCSGTNGMVLEVSATPYIFTFKLYDWGRKNPDGESRPINVEHGVQNIQWDRTTEWTDHNLVNRFEKMAEGPGWVEERTGLHPTEFIETRRHWFSERVDHQTGGGVNVLTLVDGEEVIVESPDGAFDPFIVHYAETFIVPAAVGGYSIRPHGDSRGMRCATLKAFVRTNP